MNNEWAIKELDAELNVLEKLKLSHPNIVRLFDFKQDALMVKSNGEQVRVAYIALELMEGGELFDYVALKHFDQPTCRYVFNELLSAL